MPLKQRRSALRNIERMIFLVHIIKAKRKVPNDVEKHVRIISTVGPGEADSLSSLSTTAGDIDLRAGHLCK